MHQLRLHSSNTFRRHVGHATILIIACAMTGCGSDPDQSSGTQAFDTESATPGELCAEKCARQAAADCPKTPAGYAESCRALCESKYTQFPACESELRPWDACGIESSTYSCSSTGVLTASPAGACTEQALRCASCTGDVVFCL